MVVEEESGLSISLWLYRRAGGVTAQRPFATLTPSYAVSPGTGDTTEPAVTYPSLQLRYDRLRSL